MQISSILISFTDIWFILNKTRLDSTVIVVKKKENAISWYNWVSLQVIDIKNINWKLKEYLFEFKYAVLNKNVYDFAFKVERNVLVFFVYNWNYICF